MCVWGGVYECICVYACMRVCACMGGGGGVKHRFINISSNIFVYLMLVEFSTV